MNNTKNTQNTQIMQNTQDKKSSIPDHTAVRVALWRAMHVEVDSSPHVFEDVIGLKLVAPDESWRRRPDMDRQATKGFRASIVGRARFIDDLVVERVDQGVVQYVILGAGLDSFAQRRPDMGSRIRVFEVDAPATQAWKRKRLNELGFGVPEWLRFVPVDFEAGDSWWEKLTTAGFDVRQPALISSTGVSMYLTQEANKATLRQVAALARGSCFAMTYILPMELSDPEERIGREMAEKGARAAGTPFISFFAPEQIKAMAIEAGFMEARCVSAANIIERYFARRTDGLRPTKSEELLVATV